MSSAWHLYDLSVEADGTVSGVVSTNDDLDWGEPSEWASWPVSYKNLSDALKQTGGCHFGVSGVAVTVRVNGVCVDKRGLVMPHGWKISG